MFICRSIYMYISLFLSVCLSICLSVYSHSILKTAEPIVKKFGISAWDGWDLMKILQLNGNN